MGSEWRWILWYGLPIALVIIAVICAFVWAVGSTYYDAFKRRLSKKKEPDLADWFSYQLPEGADEQFVMCPSCGMLNAAEAAICSTCGGMIAGSGAIPGEPSVKPAASQKVGTIRRDVLIGGEIAFSLGETVFILGERRDPNKPEYKYAVKSQSLNRAFLLSDKEVSV